MMIEVSATKLTAVHHTVRVIEDDKKLGSSRERFKGTKKNSGCPHRLNPSMVKYSNARWNTSGINMWETTKIQSGFQMELHL